MRPHTAPIKSLILLAGFLLTATSMWSQTDTTLQVLPDTAVVQPVDTPVTPAPVTRPGKGGIGVGGVPAIPIDTLPEAKTPAFILHISLEKITDWSKENLPHQVERNGKDRIVVKSPLHTIYLPVPKAFAPNTGRPPYDPEVAWQRSVIFPGLGQAYNRSYWKMPFVYIGYGAVVGFTVYQQNEFKRYNTAFLLNSDNNEANDVNLQLYRVADTEGLRTKREQFRKYRDYGILAIAGWHILQTVEAYVDAHLKGFDVSEDLTFRPAFSPGLGLGLSANFRF